MLFNKLGLTGARVVRAIISCNLIYTGGVFLEYNY